TARRSSRASTSAPSRTPCSSSRTASDFRASASGTCRGGRDSMTMDSSSHWPRTSEGGQDGGMQAAAGVPPPRLARREFLRRASSGASALAGGGLLAGVAGIASGCTPPARSFPAPAGPVARIPLERYPELLQPGGIIKVWRQEDHRQ